MNAFHTSKQIEPKELSLKAAGLLLFLKETHEKGSNFDTIDEARSFFTDGKHATAQAFQELEEKGFIQRKAIRENGRIKKYVCEVIA